MVSLKKKKPEIDLKKDRETGLDLEKKIDVDAGTGGIGISFDVQEFENGDKISIGYQVEPPIQLGIDYNVSSNELGLSGGFEAPGDLIGLSGGVTIDLNSGEIVGGELGVALGGVDVSIGEGKCERTISVSIAGVTTTYTQKKDNPECGDDDEGNDDDDDEGNDDDDSGFDLPDPPPIDQVPGDPNNNCWAILSYPSASKSLYFDENGKLSWAESLTVTASSSWADGYILTSGTRNYVSSDPYWPSYTQTAVTYLPVYSEPHPGAGTTPEWIWDDPNVQTYGWYNVTGSYMGQGNSFRGKVGALNHHLKGWPDISINTPTLRREAWRRVVLEFYYIFETEEKGPPPPEPPKDTPIQPPERDDMSCCNLEPVLSMLRKMNQVLAIDEMAGEGVKIPKRLFIPEAKGYEECKTYASLMATQVRIQDHLGIHPFKAEIADSNAAQAGNQKLSIRVVNATAHAKMISELLLENKSDAATRLNLLVRNTVATGQILNGVTIAAKRIREVMRFLSIPVKEVIDHVAMPFDFSFGNRDKKKGFQAGQKPAEALDINTEEATEAMLPKFMVNSKQPYVIEIFDDKQGTLLDILLKQNK